MNFLATLKTNLLFLQLSVGILGLLIGSFLNVIITRLPVILERQWTHDYQQQVNEVSELNTQPKFNLLTPRSCCPSCHHVISWIENIPVISYLVLRGRCRHCHTVISIQYPLIEICTALLSIACAYVYGPSLQTITALVLVWSLITLAVIDFNTSLLPDSLTLPLLWLGLIANSFELFCSLQDSLYGAIFGYVSLWSVFQAFKFMTKKDGMGYGDFKLLAALGAWLGWSFIIPIIFISSIVGSIVGISLITSRRLASNAAIPFGPYLVLGGLICLLLRNHVKSLFNIL